MNIQKAGELDLSKIARCHKEAFPHAFSSALGFVFLVKNFRWYLEHPDAFLLCANDDEGAVVGYAGALMMHERSVHGSSTSIMQYAFREALRALIMKPWLFFHREMWLNYRLISKNIFLKLYHKKNLSVQSKPPSKRIRSLGLVVIGTTEAARGKGVGSALLQAFENKGKELHAERLHLSVKKNNSKAIAAYTRNGWLVGGVQGNNLKMFKNL